MQLGTVFYMKSQEVTMQVSKLHLGYLYLLKSMLLFFYVELNYDDFCNVTQIY